MNSNGNGTDRLPPHSPEAEEGVLGCLLLDPESAIPEAVRILTADGFYDLRNRLVFQTLLGMYDRREPIDFISVQHRLRESGRLDEVGGLERLRVLADSTPSAANLPYYASILCEKHGARRMLQACQSGVLDIEKGDANGDTDALLEVVAARVATARDEREVTGFTDAPAACTAAIGMLEARLEGQTGLSTGYSDLDRITGGLQPGSLVVVAARPSLGKTALLANIARHVVLAGNPVAFFSLEMTTPEVALRFVCAESGVNGARVKDWTSADYARVTEANLRLSKSPLHVDDTPALAIAELRARARAIARRAGIKLVVVDYLQLVHGTGRRSDSRVVEVGEISGGLKALAKELRVPVIAACQLNRESDREGRKPRLSDLRESGSIEQDADVVSLLYRPTSDEYETEDQTARGVYPVRLFIAKNRNGEAGRDIELTFFARHQRFETAAKITDEDVPDSYSSVTTSPRFSSP